MRHFDSKIESHRMCSIVTQVDLRWITVFIGAAESSKFIRDAGNDKNDRQWMEGARHDSEIKINIRIQ